MRLLTLLLLSACADDHETDPTPSDGDGIDCDTTTTAIAASDLPSEIDVAAIAEQGGARDASGTWEDDLEDTFTVTATLADAWQHVTFEGPDCPTGLDETWTGHVDVEVVSASGRLDLAWRNEIRAATGDWSLGATVDEAAAGALLQQLGRDGTDVSVWVVWSEADLAGEASALVTGDGTADVSETILSFSSND